LPAAVLGLSLLNAAAAFGYATGPEDARAGDPPKRETCAAATCHTEFPVGSGDGSVTLVGVPASYIGGNSYPITVVLQDPGQQRWGFELTVLREDLTQAGALVVTTPQETQLSAGPGTLPDYLKQTLDGTFDEVPDGPVSWTFLWEAAEGDQRVTFYVAGNAADGNDESTGDYVYTYEIASDETGQPAIQEHSWGLVKAFYRR
jgi:hypothetical protein